MLPDSSAARALDTLRLPLALPIACPGGVQLRQYCRSINQVTKAPTLAHAEFSNTRLITSHSILGLRWGYLESGFSLGFPSIGAAWACLAKNS